MTFGKDRGGYVRVRKRSQRGHRLHELRLDCQKSIQVAWRQDYDLATQGGEPIQETSIAPITAPSCRSMTVVASGSRSSSLQGKCELIQNLVADSYGKSSAEIGNFTKPAS